MHPVSLHVSVHASEFPWAKNKVCCRLQANIYVDAGHTGTITIGIRIPL